MSESTAIGTLAQLACLLEVAAPKAGNVTPERRFEDTTWLDFAVAAAAIAPVLDQASRRPLGYTVLDAITASRDATGQNVNLGIVLLLAPLATVRSDEEPRSGVRRVLAELDAQDAERFWKAIRLAAPGGLGTSGEADIHDAPPDDVVAAMRLAADRDLVARQYADGFREVFDDAVPTLTRLLDAGLPLESAIVGLHLELVARYPDSLIARKCGDDLARDASRRAAHVLEAPWPDGADAAERFEAFDAWLRADGNRRNPGTSADLVAASLFLALRAGIIALPLRS